MHVFRLFREITLWFLSRLLFLGYKEARWCYRSVQRSLRPGPVFCAHPCVRPALASPNGECTWLWEQARYPCVGVLFCFLSVWCFSCCFACRDEKLISVKINTLHKCYYERLSFWIVRREKKHPAKKGLRLNAQGTYSRSRGLNVGRKITWVERKVAIFLTKWKQGN